MIFPRALELPRRRSPRRVIRLLLVLLLGAAAASPQRLSFGLKAGAPLTDLVKSESWKGLQYEPSSGRYTIGPVIELLFPERFSIEFDALYRPLRYRTHLANTVAETAGSAWQFPLLVKMRLSRNFVAPYLAAGVTFNRLSGLKDLAELSDSSTAGWVVGFGLEGRLPIVRISPEVRYTKWRSENLRNTAGGFGLSQTNQLEALVGITF